MKRGTATRAVVVLLVSKHQGCTATIDKDNQNVAQKADNVLLFSENKDY